MISDRYIKDWSRIEKKTLEFWEKENHDRPLLLINAPKENKFLKPIKEPDNIIDRWMDTEYIIESERRRLDTTFFGGEAYPNLWPNLGPDIIGAILGCGLTFGDRTVWAEHFVNDWSMHGKLEFDPSNKWWKKISEITEAAVADSRGDYFVDITDLHAGMDALVSLRGPENLAMDFYDNPEVLKNRTFEVLEVFKKVVDGLQSITSRNHPGSTTWMGVWHPGKWYVSSCDLICMISKQMFSEFVLPELLEELEWLDASIFHLDGADALKHLAALLDIPKLKGIQWEPGYGNYNLAQWIPLLKKIQAAGKIICAGILPEDADILLENLRPEGLVVSVDCKNEQDAKDIIRKAENAYKRKYI